MTERERNLLHREPSKLERAAGIEKLNRFADLTSLDFLRDEMKMPIEEVLLQPYNECLVRFMLAKEKADYQERYYKLLHEETEMKIKRKKMKMKCCGRKERIDWAWTFLFFWLSNHDEK